MANIDYSCKVCDASIADAISQTGTEAQGTFTILVCSDRFSEAAFPREFTYMQFPHGRSSVRFYLGPAWNGDNHRLTRRGEMFGAFRQGSVTSSK